MRQILALLLLWPCAARCEETLIAQAGFLDSASLDRFYDAAALKAGLIPMPQAASRAFRPATDGLTVPRAGEHKPAPDLVPVPAPSRAYRRTFRILISNPEKTDRFDAQILRHSRRYGLDPRFVKAIIAAESEFFIGAVSPKGAKGLMQVMPATAEELGVDSRRLHTPEGSIQAGSAYLSVLFRAAWRKFKLKGVRYHDAPAWVLQRIIAAYNAGPRFLTRTPIFRETKNYVRKVMLFYNSKVSDLRHPEQGRRAYPWSAFSGETGA